MEEEFSCNGVSVFEVVHHGVLWRQSPKFDDCIHTDGVSRGAIVRASKVQKGDMGLLYAHIIESNAWLPMTTPSGTVVLRPVGDTTPKSKR